MNTPQRAILILLDGLRPEPIVQGRMPTITSLANRGAYSYSARSVMPSITLPCIASIFLSVPPQRHQTLTNDWHHNANPLPGLFEMAHSAGLLTASFHGWDALRDLSRPNVLDFCFYHRSGDPVASQTEKEVCQFAGDWIAKHLPGFSFLYIEMPDMLGHKYGFLSREYIDGCARLDQSLADFLNRLQVAGVLNDTFLALTADHGGHDHTHGSDMPEDMTVPLILSGPGIKQGYAMQNAVSILDVAPTITHLLNLPTPPEWEGRLLQEALL